MLCHFFWSQVEYEIVCFISERQSFERTVLLSVLTVGQFSNATFFSQIVSTLSVSQKPSTFFQTEFDMESGSVNQL